MSLAPHGMHFPGSEATIHVTWHNDLQMSQMASSDSIMSSHAQHICIVSSFRIALAGDWGLGDLHMFGICNVNLFWGETQYLLFGSFITVLGQVFWDKQFLQL